MEKLCDILRQNKLEELCCSEGLGWLRLLLQLVDVTTSDAEEHLMKLIAKAKTMSESHHVQLTNDVCYKCANGFLSPKRDLIHVFFKISNSLRRNCKALNF